MSVKDIDLDTKIAFLPRNKEVSFYGEALPHFQGYISLFNCIAHKLLKVLPFLMYITNQGNSAIIKVGVKK